MQPLIPGSEHFISRPLPHDELQRKIHSRLKLHTVDESMVDQLDPTTYEVVRHRLWSITDEMGETLRRMSGSPIVTEANDFDFTVNDELGQEVQIGLYNTMLAGAIDLAIYWTLQHRSENPGIEDGDMFICNDPWIGGGLHQPDVTILSPIFYDGKLFAWTSAVAHQPDLGGSAPGSMPINAQDVFSESLPTPPVKIVRGMELQRDIVDLWVRRSRVPLLVGLDLRAKVGANKVGRRRILALIEQYGPDLVKAVMKRMMNDAEHRVKQKLRSLPDGAWRATSYQDQAYLGDRRTHRLTLQMTKQDDRLTFDFTGTAPQCGVINCTYAGSRGGVMLALLPSLAGDIPWSAGGIMRCFDIVTEEGTLNNAQFPAALNRAPIATAWAIGSLAAQCLSQMMNRKVEMQSSVQAACCGTWNTAVLAGLDHRHAQPQPFLNVVMDSMAGGYGAKPGADGVDSGGLFCIPMGKAPDVEMTELLYPLLVLWRREEPDSGGAGRHRGGVSASIAMTPYGTQIPAALVLASSGMATSQNNGLSGGAPGNLGRNCVVRETDVLKTLATAGMPTSLAAIGGRLEDAQCMAHGALAPGEVVYLHCQGGGGYGDPLRRDPAQVAADVLSGRVSVKAAHDLYGVACTAGGRVDAESTKRLRGEALEQRHAGTRMPAARATRNASDEALPMDDNVAVGAGEQITCRHCGQTLGEADGTLHLAVRDADPATAGPGVVVAAHTLLDDPVVFREYFCPGCLTRLHCAIVPADHVDVLGGLRVAMPAPIT